MKKQCTSKTVSIDVARAQQCLRDVEVAVISRDGGKLLVAVEQLEALIPLLEVDADTDITDDILPYLGMKATCNEILARLDTLSKQGEHLVNLLKRVSDNKISYDKRMRESRVLQGLDVSG